MKKNFALLVAALGLSAALLTACTAPADSSQMCIRDSPKGEARAQRSACECVHVHLPPLHRVCRDRRARAEQNEREPLGKRFPLVGFWLGDQSRTDSDSQSSTSPVAASIWNSYSVPL